MLVQGHNLFNISEVTEYMAKFEEKLQESDNKINQLKSDISKLDTEIDACMEVDVLSGTATSKKDLSNVQARKAFAESVIADEMKKFYKIKEIRDKGLAELIPQASKLIQQDLSAFSNIVERAIFSQLQVVRQQQEELLLTLALARDTALNEIFEFNQACNLAGLKQYERSASNQMFHSAGFVPNRAFPELGSPLLNCNNLQTVEDVMSRSRADANAMYNQDKAPEDKAQLPQAKTLKDINLEAFLDSLIGK